MKGAKKKGPKSPIWAAHITEQPVLHSAAGNKKHRSVRIFPPVELARMAKTKKLRSKLHKLCSKHGTKVPLLCFERWQCRAKLCEGADCEIRTELFGKRQLGLDEKREPLLPANSKFVDKGMVSDLVRAKMTVQAAQDVTTAMAEASAAMADELHALRSDIESGVYEIPAGSKVHAVFNGGVVDLSFGVEPCKPYLRISREHFKKLSTLFARNINSDPSSPVDDQKLCDHIFCLLARYEALAGHGYQAALCGDGFDVLLERFNCEAECFASPLNCRYSKFCSAFPDVDRPFGSWGSFFAEDFSPVGGAFEANPPFVPEIMLAMARKMERLLSRATEPLTFVVIVPAWKQIPAWLALESSAFLQAAPAIISAASHGFCDGAQHQRRPQERFRPSSFDTGIFILAARFDGSAVSIPAVMSELKEAMASAKGDCKSIQAYEQRIRQRNKPHGGGGDGKHAAKPFGGRGERNDEQKRSRIDSDGRKPGGAKRQHNPDAEHEGSPAPHRSRGLEDREATGLGKRKLSAPGEDSTGPGMAAKRVKAQSLKSDPGQFHKTAVSSKKKKRIQREAAD